MGIRVISALTLLGTIIVFVLFFLFAHLSTWFIWELLPPGAVKIVVNQTHPAASRRARLAGEAGRASPQGRAANLLTDYLSLTQLNSTLEQLKNTRRFSISHSSDITTAVIVPDNPLLFRNHKALTEQLNNAGFRTQRFGLLVIAQRNNDSDNIVRTKFNQAIRQTIRRLFSNTLPAKPLLIASMESGTVPFLENSLTVLGTAGGDGIQLIIAEPTIDFHSTPHNIPPQSQQENELTMAIPSHTLTTLPKPLHNEWNKILVEKLGLINTRPDILSHLAQYNSPVIIRISQNSAVIAVTKMQETFSSTVIKWVQAEEAFTRQYQRAFRLPDGTLGYELAPGDTREVFINPPSSKNCRQDSYPRLAGASLSAVALAKADGEGGPTPMHYLWLCTNGSKTAFGSDENATNKTIETTNLAVNSWNVSVGAQYLANLSLTGIKSISATGTDTQAVIHINLQ